MDAYYFKYRGKLPFVTEASVRTGEHINIDVYVREFAGFQKDSLVIEALS